MQIRLGFLRTTVGRRLFLRFLLAALLPASLTAALAYVAVKDQLHQQTSTHVRGSAKHAALNTLASLQRLETVFHEMIALAQRPNRAGSAPELALPPGFDAIARRSLHAGVPGADPEAGAARPLTDYELQHLRRGKTLVASTKAAAGRGMRVLMARFDSEAAGGVVWGWVSADALWGSTIEAMEGSSTRFCAVEVQRQQPIACDVDLPPAAMRALGDVSRVGGQTLSTWSDGRTPMYSASSAVFLRYEYGTSDWQVIVSETGDVIFASLHRFTLTFVGIMALTLLTVFFLSHAHIRRSTEPLEHLQEGTRRLAAGDFETMVRVESGDEFADLAASFNGMARALNRQIISLSSLDGLHQAALGAREIHPLLDAAAAKLGILAPASDILIGVEQDGNVVQALTRTSLAAASTRLTVGITDAEREELLGHPLGLTLRRMDGRSYLAIQEFGAGAGSTHVFPLRNENRLLGFVAVAERPPAELSDEDLPALRRLVDLLALAIADVQHVLHLDALSSGTLTAFARAIDANSPWTAGHSERVTAISIEIGGRVGLSAEELRVLRRGGLLHDIGKIGVPPAILDKAGPLTDAERAVMERHPVLGAEILAPIGTFNDAIPIVRYHHERLNGTGYPDGLRGEEIPYMARILAVADAFDALVSDRPYRAGMTTARAVSIIHEGMGSHFDPRPTAALVAAVRAGAIEPIIAAQASVAELADSVVAGRRAFEVAV